MISDTLYILFYICCEQASNQSAQPYAHVVGTKQPWIALINCIMKNILSNGCTVQEQTKQIIKRRMFADMEQSGTSTIFVLHL